MHESVELLLDKLKIMVFENYIGRVSKKLGYHVDDETKFILHLGNTVDESRYHRIFNVGLKAAG